MHKVSLKGRVLKIVELKRFAWYDLWRFNLLPTVHVQCMQPLVARIRYTPSDKKNSLGA